MSLWHLHFARELCRTDESIECSRCEEDLELRGPPLVPSATMGFRYKPQGLQSVLPHFRNLVVHPRHNLHLIIRPVVDNCSRVDHPLCSYILSLTNTLGDPSFTPFAKSGGRTPTHPHFDVFNPTKKGRRGFSLAAARPWVFLKVFQCCVLLKPERPITDNRSLTTDH